LENYLEEIITELSRADIKFIICGGVAAVLHGVERMTMDIDISLDMTKENLDKFIRSVNRLNLVPRAPVPPEFITNREKRENMINKKGALVFTFIDPNLPFRQIDVFIEEEKSFKYLKNDILKIDIGKFEINVLSIEKLLEMKKNIRNPRKKDLIDIEELQIILESKIKNEQ